MIFVIS